MELLIHRITQARHELYDYAAAKNFDIEKVVLGKRESYTFNERRDNFVMTVSYNYEDSDKVDSETTIDFRIELELGVTKELSIQLNKWYTIHKSLNRFTYAPIHPLFDIATAKLAALFKDKADLTEYTVWMAEQEVTIRRALRHAAASKANES